MRIKVLLILTAVCFSSSAIAQLAAVKILGKDASKYKMGFGVFSYYDFTLNDIGNNSVRLELLDFSYFAYKVPDVDSAKAYLSIKLGFRHVFSSESKTGFYIEPQAGYVRVVSLSEEPDYRDGIAAALEAGYTLEVGENGSNLSFGLKYETDRAGKKYQVNSIGFRISYDFHLFKRRNN